MAAQSPSSRSPELLSRPPQFLLWALACVLLACAQLLWAGYQLGIGNQAIQIAFLQALHNPQLFTRDIMVVQTLHEYPSMFFRILALFLSVADLPTLYLALHLLATAGVFIAIAALSRSIYDDHWAALVSLLILLAGHHQSLAGESFYSSGFTHTWAVFPLGLLALALLYRERYWSAFALAGAILNFHALEAAHLGVIFGIVGLCLIKQIGWRKLAALLGIFALTASPTLWMIITQHHAPFDPLWLQLTHVRSADHSFPSSWWQPGTPDLPRFACILALAALALSFPMPAAARRKTWFALAAFGLLFAAGYLFTEIWPVPIVIRAQLYRSSRFLLAIAFILIAYAAVCAFRLPWQKPSAKSNWCQWLEFASAAFTLATLAIPAWLVLLPAAVAIALLTALISGRLAWYQALAAGASLIICLAAWQQSLHFLLPLLSPEITWRGLVDFVPPPLLTLLLLAPVALLWWLSQRYPTKLITLVSTAAVTAITIPIFLHILHQPPADAPWFDVQQWVRAHTPVDALILTPSQPGGFRIYSERSVVAEWRDGTQLYFNPAFAQPWWDRIKRLQADLVLKADGRSFLTQGRPLGQLDEEEICRIAHDYNADLVVLPHNDLRAMEKLYDNGTWTVYHPKQVSQASIFTADMAPAQKEFLQTVALPNIEKYRKSDLSIRVVDQNGNPLAGAAYTLTQTASSFGFGCSLPFFDVPKSDFGADYRPPAVTPAQLAHFAEFFNYSVTAFSGQWIYTEPEQDKPDYTDLDHYVDWCTKNHTRVELKFLAGYQPPWVRNRDPDDQATLLAAHARQLVERYRDRVDSWEVTDEKIGIDQAAAIFAQVRKVAPKARLGIGDDTRFWSPRPAPARDEDMQRGLNDLRELKKQGIQVDFFSMHAHRPLGLWAVGKDIYDTLDAYAKEGVRIHVTEFGVPVGARIEGPVRSDCWTPQLQADYYTQFFTICFSHPNVDVINIFSLGSKSWIEGEGLLDNADQPTPAFAALRKLIIEHWRTNAAGSLLADGSLAVRGFHGTYTLTITPAASAITVPLTIAPGQSNHYTFKLDTQAGTLVPWEGH